MQIAKIIKDNLKTLVKEYYNIEVGEVFLEHPDNEKWGDYATNLPMKLAGRIKQSPVEIAKKLCYGMRDLDLHFELGGVSTPIFSEVSFIAPGFLNLVFTPNCLNYLLNITLETTKNYGGECSTGLFEIVEDIKDKRVVIEYTDPNPFKEFHIGHLMSNSIGESLSRIYEYLGAQVVRANYQGDVGMHVAKSVWGMKTRLEQEKITLADLEQKPLEEIASFLGKSYALGATAYKEDEESQEEMKALNYALYIISQKMHAKEGHSPVVNYEEHLAGSESQYLEKIDLTELEQLYVKGRKWSLDYFETLYTRLGTKFDKYYFESLMGEFGFKIVMDQLGGPDKDGVFTVDNDAVIFKGEDYGLHTRVFINSLGLPTYEAKEIGLAHKKYEDFHFDKAVVVTANEIDEYFKVVLKALSLISPEIASRVEHISHGVMRLSEGKMSSRTGNIVTGKELLDSVKEVVAERMSPTEFTQEEIDTISDKIAVSAVKYGILKTSLGKDIVYDSETSLDVKGNTGPYLQYTFVRTKSVLDKAPLSEDLEVATPKLPKNLSQEEVLLLRYIYQFTEFCERALIEKSPHFICDYLFNLAQKFNLFYANQPILNCDSEEVRNYRLFITLGVYAALERGLYLLGISPVPKM